MSKQLRNQQHPLQSRAIRPWLFLALAVAFYFAIFHCNRAFGQLASGTINGTVTDSQGSAIVEASVSIRNTDTQVVTATKTKADGSFEVGALILGHYEVTFDAPGFKKIVETNIRLEATGIVKLDEHMAPGATTTTVEVDAQGANLQTETVSNSTTLEQQLVENAPAVPVSQSAYRDPTMLVNLTPGTSGSFSGVQLAGGRTVANETLVDGVPQLFQPLNVTAALVMHPTMDIVSSVYTQPGVPAPEYGRDSGGVVAELTKSGSSQYHGDAEVFFRNKIFDAKAYNVAAAGKDEQYELPVSFGGPVWIPHLYNGRKRTFFFFNYTRYWNDSTNPVWASVPTMAERTGDFSDWLPANGIIYDPTTQVNGVRTAFPGNKLTPTSAIGQKLANLYPQPTNGATTINYLNNAPNGRTEAHWFYRIDHNITDNSSLHWTFHADSSDFYQPSSFDVNDGYSTDQLMSIWHDWILSPSLLNHVMVSAIHYNNINTTYGPRSTVVPPASIPAIPGTYPLGRFAGMPPGFTFSVYSPLFTLANNPNSEWTYDYQDAVSWTKGKHTLKFGARFDAFQDNASNPLGMSGTFNFTSSNTGIGSKNPPIPTGASAGNSVASLLLGYVNSASTSVNVSGYGRSKYFAVYAEDSWRVTPKLTANYGIRWEMQTPINDAMGNMTTMNPTLANSAAGGIPGALIYAGTGTGRTGSDQFLTTWKGGYGPRVGLAYDLGHNTVIRAGYGIMYAPYVLFAGWMTNPGYDQKGFSLSSSATTADSGYTAAFNLDSGFPAADLITSTTLTPTLYNGQAVTMTATQNGKDNRLQDNQVWQLDLQKTFGTWYIAAGYVGQAGHHIPQSNEAGANNGGGIPFNQVNSKYLNLGTLLTQKWNSVDPVTKQTYLAEAQAIDSEIALPYASFTGTIAQMLRPFPQYLGVTGVMYPSGSSSWDGFLLKVQKNYANGFSLLASYTWSKEFSNAGFNRISYINTTQDQANSKGQKSLGDSNMPQILVLSYLYELPFGPGKKFLNSGPLSYFAGGFGLSALQNYRSGLPIHITSSATALPIFNPGLFVNIVPGVQQKLASRRNTVKYNALYDPAGTAHGTKWLNAAAFANPAPYSFGNSRSYLDHLQQLAILNESMSAFKRTPVNADGTRYIELRVEMFNIFNRQNYATLNTTLANPHFGEYTGEYNDATHSLDPGPKVTEMEMRIIF